MKAELLTLLFGFLTSVGEELHTGTNRQTLGMNDSFLASQLLGDMNQPVDQLIVLFLLLLRR